MSRLKKLLMCDMSKIYMNGHINLKRLWASPHLFQNPLPSGVGHTKASFSEGNLALWATGEILPNFDISLTSVQIKLTILKHCQLGPISVMMINQKMMMTLLFFKDKKRYSH